MRISLTAALVCAGFLAGCTSSSGIDDLGLKVPVDRNTTGSVVRPPSMPPVGLARAGVPKPAAARAPEKVELAMLRAEDPTRGRMPEVISKGERTIYRASFGDAKPIDFGRKSPKPFEVHGVDVSRWQGQIDWAELRTRGANFAYIKATDGGDHLDPAFMRNWNGAAAAGIPRGAYHFFYWCRVASEQAEWFIRNVPKVKGALPPVVDVEWNGDSKTCRKRPSQKVVLEKMKVFMDMVERHYGQKPVIYTAPDFYEDNLKGQFRDHSFWLRSVAAHPSEVYPGREFAFWQYSGTGLAHGHETQIDLNVFNGTADSWHRWLEGRTH
ncbi:lysozyme [Hoeflea marina]|uniref:Lysozyme n=1 Tax=Hoeflea marina TaxID=274592 RepID=A0A317PR00_9HYPH|nr:GH25 family lysozyme [Hoeflea marina]PWW01990.1 lysozyme [Hoeflea marina]